MIAYAVILITIISEIWVLFFFVISLDSLEHCISNVFFRIETPEHPRWRTDLTAEGRLRSEEERNNQVNRNNEKTPLMQDRTTEERSRAVTQKTRIRTKAGDEEKQNQDENRAVKSEGECGDVDADPFEKCMESAEPLRISELNEMPDEDFLKSHCSPSIERMECLRDALQKCPELLFYMSASDAMTGVNSILNLLHSICDEDSETRKGYIENLGCYNTAYPQMIECVNRSHAIVKDFFNSLDDDPELTHVIHSDCLSMPLQFNCIVEVTVELCGQEATDPLDDILSQLSSIITKFDCPEDDLAEWESRFLVFMAEQALQDKK